MTDESVQDPLWVAVHRYNRAVRAKRVAALRCPECRIEYITKIGPDVNPVLHCFICKANVTVGIDLRDKMNGAVDESERQAG